MGNYARDHHDPDSPTARLPEGLSPSGYDADREVYTYRDAKDGGIWESLPGNKYGKLTQVSGPGFRPKVTEREQAMFARDLQKQTHEPKDTPDKDEDRDVIRKERRRERALKREQRAKESEAKHDGDQWKGGAAGVGSATSPEVRKGSPTRKHRVHGDVSPGSSRSSLTSSNGGNNPSPTQSKTNTQSHSRNHSQDSTHSKPSSLRRTTPNSSLRSSRNTQARQSHNHDTDSFDEPPPPYLKPSRRFTSFGQLDPQHVSRPRRATTASTSVEDSSNPASSVASGLGKISRAVSLRVGKGLRSGLEKGFGSKDKPPNN
jgi:hypothetical protein